MGWTLTLALSGACVLVLAFCGWRDSRPPDLVRGPRMAPYRAIMLLTLVMLRRIGPHFDDAVIGLGSSDYSLRWYHVYSTVAFLVANLCNFQLNRTWTFRSGAA